MARSVVAVIEISGGWCAVEDGDDARLCRVLE
jgi:hypothetical protein